MRDIFIQADEETSKIITKQKRGRLDISKPYVAVFLIITILLSIWAGICAS